MIENKTKIELPGTIFLHGRIEKETVCKALTTVFEIPNQNIIINSGTTEEIDWERQSVLAHSYDKGDIGWMLDFNLAENLANFPAKLLGLSILLGCPLYWDRHGIEYDDRVDVYNPECVQDGAMLTTQYDESEDPFFFVELVK